MSTSPAPAPLVTVSNAATLFKVSTVSVGNWIKRVGVSPKATTLIGGNAVTLYDLKDLEDARSRYALMKPPKSESEEPHTSSVDLEPLVARMSAEYQGLFRSVSADLAELVDTVALLKDAINSVKEQNVLIFKAVEALRLAQATPAAPRTFVKAADPVEVKPPPKPKVCIVGVLGAQQTMISKEFDQIFDLKMFETDEAKGPSLAAAVQGSERTLLMANFISHKTEDLVRAAGGKYEVVRGGMTTLRDRLITLFANSTPTKKEAA